MPGYFNPYETPRERAARVVSLMRACAAHPTKRQLRAQLAQAIAWFAETAEEDW
jgi:CHASE3 domain sensor protein